MKIFLNGAEREIDGESLDVAALLDQLGLRGLPVLVELNGEALLKGEFGERLVTEGAKVEIVRMVAGG